MASFEYPEWADIGAYVSLNRDHPDNNQFLVLGDVGVIVYRAAGILYVEWDKDCGGHSCGRKAELGHGWNVRPEDVCPVCLFSDEEIEYEPTSMDELLSLFTI